MKIIEALKKINELTKKHVDLTEKIHQHCADMDFETSVYVNQQEKISEWLQSAKDIIQEIGRLKYCIQKTNVMTDVTIIIDDKEVTKSITEWINRRRLLAALDKKTWSSLTNRGLRDNRIQQSQGTIIDVKVRYYFDPVKRDKMLDILTSEPFLIDSKLEVVNAITDLIE